METPYEQTSQAPEPQARTDFRDIWGSVRRVTAAPAWIPRKVEEEIAIDETNNRFYWYDYASSSWLFTPASPINLATDVTGILPTANGGGTVVTVTAGEILTAGEVVCLKLGTGNNLTQGYQWSNGAVYAVRAAADNTTYGENVLGIMASAATYLGTGTCAQVGDITGLSGLTAGLKHYLNNYGASSETITQSSQDAEFTFDGTNVVRQMWIPTSSRLDKLVLKIRKNGGAGSNITVDVKRVNTIIATITQSMGGTPPF